MKIWIAVIEHRHGHNVYAARTKAKITNDLYDYVKQWWESEIPEEMPVKLSKKEAVDKYFEMVEHEWLETVTSVNVE